MIKAILKIWYKCNYSCNFCHAKFKKSIKNISIKSLFLKIILLKKKWVQLILLSWWESTLELHFFQIVNFIKKQWLYFWIVTNWSTIYNDPFYNKLLDLEIKNIYLSIHWKEEAHNMIVWDNNWYNKVISIIKKIKKTSSIDLFLNYVVIKDNINSINDTLNDLDNLNLDLNIKFSMLIPEWAWLDDKLMISPLKASRIIKNNIDVFSLSKLKIYWDWYQLCLFRWYLDKIWNLQTESILYMVEVYENKIFSTDYWIRSYLKECSNCDLKKDCYWIIDKYISFYETKDLLIK